MHAIGENDRQITGAQMPCLEIDGDIQHPLFHIYHFQLIMQMLRPGLWPHPVEGIVIRGAIFKMRQQATTPLGIVQRQYTTLFAI